LALPWLSDVLAASGLAVVEVGNWRTRSAGTMQTPTGVLGHHTAGPAAGNYPSLQVVVDGRPGLSGPLSNLGLGRDGTWFVIAGGRAHHAGAGSLPWVPRDRGNEFLIGVEAESTGRGDWTAAQRDSYPRGVAALLRYLGLPASRFAGHKEYAPTRKIDPFGWPGDMAGFRISVQTILSGEGGSPMSQAEVNQLRADIGFARDQILSFLGVQNPESAPAHVDRDTALMLENARRTDVGYAMDQIIAAVLTRPLSDADVERIARRVAELLGAQEQAPIPRAAPEKAAKRTKSRAKRARTR
jgi:N-acetylmuramoyl-L-alanine amidase